MIDRISLRMAIRPLVSSFALLHARVNHCFRQFSGIGPVCAFSSRALGPPIRWMRSSTTSVDAGSLRMCGNLAASSFIRGSRRYAKLYFRFFISSSPRSYKACSAAVILRENEGALAELGALRSSPTERGILSIAEMRKSTISYANGR